MFKNVEGLNLKPWFTVCLLPGTLQEDFMQEELRATMNHSHHVGLHRHVLPLLSGLIFFFFFSFVQSSQLTFPRLAEDRMKPSGLSAAQMCQNVFAECSVTMHYSWKVFLNMCPFPESCLAVSLGTFPNVCCSWKYCTMLRVASYL